MYKHRLSVLLPSFATTLISAALPRSSMIMLIWTEDEKFSLALLERGSAALEDYQLSLEAKAAIISGDLKWINEHVGELTQKQLMFVYRRLENEAW